MSVPPLGYFDIWEDGKIVNGPTSYLVSNKGALDVSFSLNEAFTDTSKINLLAFDYDFRTEVAPYEYTSYDALGITVVGFNGFAFSLQGSDIDFSFGGLNNVDVLSTTNKNDTIILTGDKGPEAVFTGQGNDFVAIHGTQALTSLGRGSDTFISTDDIADLVLADSYGPEGAADQITVSKGSLVILTTIPGESNSNVVSATGNQNDITVMTEDQFEGALIADPLGFMQENDTIDIGLILAAAQEKLVNLYVGTPTFLDGVPGTFTDQGNFVPADAEIFDLLHAFRQTNEGEYGQAITTLTTQLDMDVFEAASVVRDMAGTYDADNAYDVPQPMGFCTFPAADYDFI